MFGMQIGQMGQVGGFSLTRLIASMYQNGEQGALYDPSDLSTLFQDTAGTVPVTAVEQAVALMLDKSGRGNHASQATSSKRFRYSRRINLLAGSTTLATQSITTRAAGYKIVFSGTGSVTLSGTATGVYGAGTNSITCTAGTLTLTVSGSVQDASFHLLTDSHLVYQWVNTDTDYDADPNKFPAYLACDGIDDAMQTGNINFTGTDKMTVWAGIAKLSDAAPSTLLELSVNSYSNLGTIGLFTPTTVNGNDIAQRSIGTSERVLTVGGFTSPMSFVVTGYMGITPPIIGLRIAGSVIGTTSASQGTGNYGNYPLYIGARAGASLFFNGRLYSLIVRGAATPLPQIEAVETLIRQKMRLP